MGTAGDRSPPSLFYPRPLPAIAARVHYGTRTRQRPAPARNDTGGGTGDVIQPDDGSKDVFVHISAVERAGLRTLNDGQKVSYDLEATRQGKVTAANLQAV